MAKLKHTLVLILVAALLLSFGFSNDFVMGRQMGRPAFSITWAPAEISRSISPGYSWEFDLTLTSNRDLVGAWLFVTPEIEPFVVVSPQNFDTLTANTANTINMRLAVPSDAEPNSAYDGTIELRVGQRVLPQVLKIRLYIAPALETITEDAYNAGIELERAASALFYDSEPSLGTESARQAALDFLKEQDEVFDAGISEDGSIWVAHKNGLHSLIPTHPPGTFGSGYTTTEGVEVLEGTVASNLECVTPGSRQAILLWPLCSDPEMQPTNPELTLRDIMDYIQETLTAIDYQVTPVRDSDVTVDLLKSLYQYGVVDFVTHGSVWSNQVILMTGEDSSFRSFRAHLGDLRAHRLARRTTVLGSNWSIRPSFITHYAAEPYPSSLIVATACSSFANFSMANAFLEKGAYVYAGWSNETSTICNPQLFSGLAEGMNVQTAFNMLVENNWNRCSISGAIFSFYPPHHGDLCLVSPVALYAGGNSPGVVYKYLGGTDWEIISPELGSAVLSLVEYEGSLYAGTMSQPWGDIGQVYRYDGGNNWTLVGDNLDGQVASLAVYDGDLYAGTAYGAMKLYRYNGSPHDWTLVVNHTPWYGTRSLHVFGDYLLMGDYTYDYFGRWDGTGFHADFQGGGSCIYDYADYGGYVYAAAWYGRLWQSSNGIDWDLALGYDWSLGNIWQLEVFEDQLFMAYNSGELRASSLPDPDRGSLYFMAPDGIISMTTDGNNLYYGTGGEAGYSGQTSGIASVYKYDGSSVALISDYDEMGAGVQVLYWR